MNFPGSKLPPPWRGFDHLYETVLEKCVATGGNTLMLLRKGAGSIALIDALPAKDDSSGRLVRLVRLGSVPAGVSATINVISETPEDLFPDVAAYTYGVIRRNPGDDLPLIDYLVGDGTKLKEVDRLPASHMLNHVAALVYDLSDWKSLEIPEPSEFAQP